MPRAGDNRLISSAHRDVVVQNQFPAILDFVQAFVRDLDGKPNIRESLDDAITSWNKDAEKNFGYNDQGLGINFFLYEFLSAIE